MISQSVHKVKFAKVFSLNRIVREPEDEEMANDSHVPYGNNAELRNIGRSDGSDEEEENPEEVEVTETMNRPSISPTIKIEAPIIQPTPTSEKARTPQNFSQAIRPQAHTQQITPVTPVHNSQQPSNSTISEVSSNIAQFQSNVILMGQQ